MPPRHADGAALPQPGASHQTYVDNSQKRFSECLTANLAFILLHLSDLVVG